MSYKKDQGRYARMAAFWGLTLLIAYGCFHRGGLITVLDRNILPESVNHVIVEQFPLVGSLRVSTLIALAITALSGWVIYRSINRPQIAEKLIETEGEMHKVTWPTWGETWTGTVAVSLTVVVLFAFLTLVDLLLTEILVGLMGGGA